jgi:formate dehydrogenase major subunit
VLRPGDTLDVNPSDADRLRLAEGDRVTVTSRWGQAVLPVRCTASVKPGELFSTFHSPDLFVNELTSAVRDGITSTPEYKVTAVALQKIG